MLTVERRLDPTSEVVLCVETTGGIHPDGEPKHRVAPLNLIIPSTAGASSAAPVSRAQSSPTRRSTASARSTSTSRGTATSTMARPQPTLKFVNSVRAPLGTIRSEPSCNRSFATRRPMDSTVPVAAPTWITSPTATRPSKSRKMPVRSRG